MVNISRRAVLVAFSVLGVMAQFGAARAAGEMSVAGKRVALQGYDPVSYFTDGRPEKGSAEFSASFDDATYWFRNAEHQALFIADPDHYAPRFNGYCAVRVSRGEKHEADPEQWAIADGKLWVFGGARAVSTFRQQTAEIISKATNNWSDVRQQTAR